MPSKGYLEDRQNKMKEKYINAKREKKRKKISSHDILKSLLKSIKSKPLLKSISVKK